MRKARPAPFVPEGWHGRKVLVTALCHAGPLAEGEAAAAPFRPLGERIADLIAPHSFGGWQSAFDVLLTPGARNYWKGHDFTDISDSAIQVLLGACWRLPGDECEIFIGQLGGRINRVPPDATSYARRDINYAVNGHTQWRDPADAAACIGWAPQVFDALAPHATGSVYVNFMPAD